MDQTASSVLSGSGDGGKKPYLLGITGSIACGKGFAAECLAAESVAIVDIDEISHQLLDTTSTDPSSAYQQILAHFGADLVNASDGKINRIKLRKAAFASCESREKLEGILHPAILNQLKQQIDEFSSRGVTEVAVQVPLLHDSQLESTFDEIWVVTATTTVQVSRLKARDSLTDDQARSRINKLCPQEAKIATSHRQINNSGTKEQTRQQVLHCLELSRASQKHGRLVKCNNASCLCCNSYSPALSTSAGSTQSELDGKMVMSVQNSCSKAQPAGCSCGCGSTCHVSCSCLPSCPCCPPPTSATPPASPPPPACHPHADPFLSFLAFLAFLVFACVGISYLVRDDRRDEKPSTSVVIVCSGGHRSPSPPPTPAPSQTELPTVPPSEPPPPVPTPVCQSGTVRSENPPNFVLPYLHNQVRQRATVYVTSYKPCCSGATLEAWYRQPSGSQFMLLNRQEYGSNLTFTQQWIVNYAELGNYLWVDRFEYPNLFTGRTLYEYNSTGKLIMIRRLDDRQRMLCRVTIDRCRGGEICSVYFERFNLFGVALEQRYLQSLDEALSIGDFYLTAQFAGRN